MEKQIYISYRRAGGTVLAKLVGEKLEALGFSVFYDADSITAGVLATDIRKTIEQCSDFVLILSPNALDRCENDGDQMRQEICYALSLKKNIVPIQIDGFRYPSSMPDDMKALPLYSAIRFSIEYIDACIDKLASHLKSMPHGEKNKVLTPYEGSESYIFISYAHKDTERVLPILKKMTKEGFRIWYDAGIKAGTEWPEYIARHLEKASAVLAFLSPASIDSKNCRQEINYAIDLDIPTLTVYLDKLDLTGGMRMRVGLLQAIFYYRHASLDSFFGELYHAELLSPCLEKRTKSLPTPTPQPMPVSTPQPSSTPTPTSTPNDADFVIQNGVLLEYRGENPDVIIPESVRIIGCSAFNRSKITSVVIGKSVEEIGQSAFTMCQSLTEVYIAGGVREIGHAAFICCQSLCRVTIEEGVSLIGNNMFALCGALETITIPSSVIAIEPYAFAGCSSLKSVTLSQGLTVIMADSFSGCTALERIVIPTSVKIIGQRAFWGCTALKKAYVSKNTKYARYFSRSFPKTTWVVEN